jgi:hypothetical protein
MGPGPPRRPDQSSLNSSLSERTNEPHPQRLFGRSRTWSAGACGADRGPPATTKGGVPGEPEIGPNQTFRQCNNLVGRRLNHIFCRLTVRGVPGGGCNGTQSTRLCDFFRERANQSPAKHDLGAAQAMVGPVSRSTRDSSGESVRCKQRRYFLCPATHGRRSSQAVRKIWSSSTCTSVGRGKSGLRRTAPILSPSSARLQDNRSCHAL